MIISFAGHASVSPNNKLKKIIKDQIEICITGIEHISFYLGGYGGFDDLCANICRELKEEHKNIELIYITPYISLSEQKKIKEMLRIGLYDDSIYPFIENTPPKFAISKRNRWMMINADIIIAYVDHNYGGAYKSLQIAKSDKKKIINIIDFI